MGNKAKPRYECPAGCDGGYGIVGGPECSTCNGKGTVTRLQCQRWLDKHIGFWLRIDGVTPCIADDFIIK